MERAQFVFTKVEFNTAVLNHRIFDSRERERENLIIGN